MVRKFFLLDKNYLLEKAQLELEHGLLNYLLEHVKNDYELRYNPLGIADAFTQKIRDYKLEENTSLRSFYETLAGVYRYKFGDNQLEFLWDGAGHSEKYRNEWTDFFKKQVKSFCKSELFIKAVLDLTVFNNYSPMAENRMNNFMLQTFEIRMYKGLIKTA
ncbi:MAG: hypothetical protein WDO14_00080 [Bacteroidota bacterium]